MIDITHIKWDGNKIGIAKSKLLPGNNDVRITAKNKSGILFYPHPFTVNKEDAISKYGISKINEPNLMGVWIPIGDIKFDT